MALLPHDDQKKEVAHQLQIRSEKKPRPGLWKRFVDGVRQTIGLKPLHLAERWAEAEIAVREAEASKSVYEGMATFENAKAARLKAEGEHRRDCAAADNTAAKTELVRVMTEKLEGADKLDPQEARENLRRAIEAIQREGGTVEIEFPQLPGDEEQGGGS